MSNIHVPNLHAFSYAVETTGFWRFPQNKHRTRFHVQSESELRVWLGNDVSRDLNTWFSLTPEFLSNAFERGIYGPIYIVAMQSNTMQVLSSLQEDPVWEEGPPVEYNHILSVGGSGNSWGFVDGQFGDIQPRENITTFRAGTSRNLTLIQPNDVGDLPNTRTIIANGLRTTASVNDTNQWFATDANAQIIGEWIHQSGGQDRDFYIQPLN